MGALIGLGLGTGLLLMRGIDAGDDQTSKSAAGEGTRDSKRGEPQPEDH